uniref:Uncharacterized protein n=1 Tax=Rhizophora mucronata TaxID=61149 RepID=A0A2P2MB83_RHIMU
MLYPLCCRYSHFLLSPPYSDYTSTRIYQSVLISATLIFWAHCFVTAQHSLPYNIAGLTIIW